jgi:hypothetical protein
MSDGFDRKAAAAWARATPKQWRAWLPGLLPGIRGDWLDRAAQAACDAGQDALAHADRPWQARGFAWQRHMERAAPPDDDAAVALGGLLGNILQVVPSQAAKLQRPGPTLTAELEAVKERQRREAARTPQPHRVEIAHTWTRERPARGAGRERRERRSTRPTRAGPDDSDGPAAPRPRRSAPLNPHVPSRRSRDDHPCPPHWRRR